MDQRIQALLAAERFQKDSEKLGYNKEKTHSTLELPPFTGVDQTRGSTSNQNVPNRTILKNKLSSGRSFLIFER